MPDLEPVVKKNVPISVITDSDSDSDDSYSGEVVGSPGVLSRSEWQLYHDDGAQLGVANHRVHPAVKHQPIIKKIIVMGDSLSDRGTLDHRKLLGVFSMAELSGLKGYSPHGGFTNGLLWDDFWLASLANQFVIDKMKSYLDETEGFYLGNDDLADRFIEGEHKLKHHMGKCKSHHGFKKQSLSDSNIHGGTIRPDHYPPPMTTDSYTLEDDKAVAYNHVTWART